MEVQVAARHKVHHHAQLRWILEGIVQPHEEGVVDPLQDVALVLCVVDVFAPANRGLRQDLHGIEMPGHSGACCCCCCCCTGFGRHVTRKLATHEHDLAKVAFAQGCHHLKVNQPKLAFRLLPYRMHPLHHLRLVTGLDEVRRPSGVKDSEGVRHACLLARWQQRRALQLHLPPRTRAGRTVVVSQGARLQHEPSPLPIAAYVALLVEETNFQGHRRHAILLRRA
eukprot:COSAG01_NODE_1561_length_9917_cov_5.742514_7_plen_225_part_00